MAESQSNARLRANAGAPTSGVIHIRTRLTANFTVVGNDLAQMGWSAVTGGVALYISSLPDGAPVSIAALCKHFPEGEILISRALRELEAAGYLERRRERGADGRIRTLTFWRDVPGQEPDPDPDPDPDPLPPVQAPVPEPQPAAPAEHDERAVAILASLRIVDPRLILSRRDVAELAPAVTQWLAAGVGQAQITARLTTGLPDHFRARPARLLAHRLSELPLVPAPAPAPAAQPPWQNCDGCERAFRAPEPRPCRDCASPPVRAA